MVMTTDRLIYKTAKINGFFQEYQISGIRILTKFEKQESNF